MHHGDGGAGRWAGRAPYRGPPAAVSGIPKPAPELRGSTVYEHSVTKRGGAGRRAARALRAPWDGTQVRLRIIETGAELRRFEGHEHCGHQRDGAGRRAARALGIRRSDAAAVGSRDRRRAAPVRGTRALGHQRDGAGRRAARALGIRRIGRCGCGISRPAPNCAGSRGTSDWVTSVTVLADGRRALSGSGGSDAAAVGSRDRRRTAPLRGARGLGHQRDGAGRRTARALGIRRIRRCGCGISRPAPNCAGSRARATGSPA